MYIQCTSTFEEIMIKDFTQRNKARRVLRSWGIAPALWSVADSLEFYIFVRFFIFCSFAFRFFSSVVLVVCYAAVVISCFSVFFFYLKSKIGAPLLLYSPLHFICSATVELSVKAL